MSEPQFKRIINALGERWSIPLYVTATQKLERAVNRFDREWQMHPASFRINLEPSSGQGGRT